MNVSDGSGTVSHMAEFDVEATNALASAKQAEAALASVALMKEQLAASKKENKRMFIIALITAMAAILSSLPELLSIINTLFFKG
ncbi:MAG: hypothetical protein VB035_14910 [Candidatus Fimivivens sp.]|nr:hypothetical protein [Candidatus Fimivivens sp.]